MISIIILSFYIIMQRKNPFFLKTFEKKSNYKNYSFLPNL